MAKQQLRKTQHADDSKKNANANTNANVNVLSQFVTKVPKSSSKKIVEVERTEKRTS